MLRGDIHIPFGNLQTADETVMNDHALSPVLARSFNLINLYLFNQFTKNDGVQRFHLHKAPYRLTKFSLVCRFSARLLELIIPDFLFIPNSTEFHIFSRLDLRLFLKSVLILFQVVQYQSDEPYAADNFRDSLPS